MGSDYLISHKWALTSRFAITDETGAPHFEVRGRFALASKLSVCDGVAAAAVTQLQPLREQFAVQVTPGEDAVLMLAVVLAIETIRDNLRFAAAASG